MTMPMKHHSAPGEEVQVGKLFHLMHIMSLYNLLIIEHDPRRAMVIYQCFAYKCHIMPMDIVQCQQKLGGTVQV